MTSPASTFETFRTELAALADSWDRQSAEIRTLEDEYTDPILAAHRLGRCDTFEDAADQIRNRLRRATTTSAFTREFTAISDQWTALAQWARQTLSDEPHDLTRAYREGTASAFEDSAAKVIHALSNVKSLSDKG
jgi:hypothetical protein